MENMRETQGNLTDVQRLESLNLTLVTMLEASLRQGDHTAAEKYLHYISWNESQIARLHAGHPLAPDPGFRVASGH
jgi:hypothetical protein